jgi:hypothetical protein
VRGPRPGRSRLRRALWAVLSAGLAALLCGGCGVGGAPAAAGPSWMRAALSFDPDPPVARRFETVDLTLTSAAGRPLLGAHVRFHAVMPGMSHPGADLVLRPLGDGRYGGRVVLVMGGRWVARVRVAAGRRSARVDLPFEVAE